LLLHLGIDRLILLLGILDGAADTSDGLSGSANCTRSPIRHGTGLLGSPVVLSQDVKSPGLLLLLLNLLHLLHVSCHSILTDLASEEIEDALGLMDNFPLGEAGHDLISCTG